MSALIGGQGSWPLSPMPRGGLSDVATIRVMGLVGLKELMVLGVEVERGGAAGVWFQGSRSVGDGVERVDGGGVVVMPCSVVDGSFSPVKAMVVSAGNESLWCMALEVDVFK